VAQDEQNDNRDHEQRDQGEDLGADGSGFRESVDIHCGLSERFNFHLWFWGRGTQIFKLLRRYGSLNDDAAAVSELPDTVGRQFCRLSGTKA